MIRDLTTCKQAGQKPGRPSPLPIRASHGGRRRRRSRKPGTRGRRRWRPHEVVRYTAAQAAVTKTAVGFSGRAVARSARQL